MNARVNALFMGIFTVRHIIPVIHHVIHDVTILRSARVYGCRP